MSAIEDIITAIDGVLEKISEATTGTAGAAQEAEEALGAAVALGSRASVEGLTQVQTELEALATQLVGVNKTAEEVKTTAEAVAEST
jgi:hypothetical protein